MKEAVERIEKEKTSSFIQQIQRKCFPFPSKRIVDSQNHYFKFEYEKSRSPFQVVKGVSRVNDNFVVCLSRKELVVADVEKKTFGTASDASVQILLEADVTIRATGKPDLVSYRFQNA